jgi:lipoprotein-anchoring transpeptidase ErfK/SrfK
MRYSLFPALLLGALLSGCGTFGNIYTIIPSETVNFTGKYAPGTIVVNTSQRRLYFVQEGGKAKAYAIAVGDEGRSWSGVSIVSDKREWPDWNPPEQMRKRKPELPVHMAGGPTNPLGARALYLGSTLYRIHGTNEPWAIGQAASSGCIRMYNEDVVELYAQTKIGATVVVQ